MIFLVNLVDFLCGDVKLCGVERVHLAAWAGAAVWQRIDGARRRGHCTPYYWDGLRYRKSLPFYLAEIQLNRQSNATE